MRKSLRTITMVLLVAIMSITLAACNGKDPKPNDPPTTTRTDLSVYSETMTNFVGEFEVENTSPMRMSVAVTPTSTELGSLKNRLSKYNFKLNYGMTITDLATQDKIHDNAIFIVDGNVLHLHQIANGVETIYGKADSIHKYMIVEDNSTTLYSFITSDEHPNGSEVLVESDYPSSITGLVKIIESLLHPSHYTKAESTEDKDTWSIKNNATLKIGDLSISSSVIEITDEKLTITYTYFDGEVKYENTMELTLDGQELELPNIITELI